MGASPGGAPPAPPPPGINFQRLGGGGGDSHRIQLDLDTTFHQVLNAIYNQGAEITWQTPPESIQFVWKKKDMWNTSGTTIRYNGEARFTRIDESMTQVSITLSLVWSSIIPVMVGIILLVIVMSMCNYMFAAFFLFIVIGLVAYQLWVFASQLPTKFIDRVLQGLPKATGMPGGQGMPRPGGGFPGGPGRPGSAGGGPQAQQGPGPMSPPRPAPHAPNMPPMMNAAPQHGGHDPALTDSGDDASASAPAGSSKSIAERIKELAALRDAGAISDEEYQSKKSDLLKQL